MEASHEFRIPCAQCPIRERAVCSRCDDGELDALEAIKFYSSYSAGQTIALRGDAMNVVASLVVGTATLERTMDDGRMQVVGLLLPSDFIGRPGRADLQYDITAVSDVTLCCFRREPFEEMLSKTPHLAERLMEMALDELDSARDWMLLLGRKKAREKLATLLMLVLKRTIGPRDKGKAEAYRLDLPTSRETIANFLGLTIETVSRQLTALRKDGVIELDGKRGVLIPDIKTLMAETGDDQIGSELLERR